MGRPKTVDNSGTTDVLHDVIWVYNNAKKLFRHTKDGLELDLRVQAQAPSSGAWLLAEYARGHFKEFCEKFVIKMLPKDAGRTEASTEKELQDQLDPDFAALNQFLTPEGPDEATEMDSDSSPTADSEPDLPETDQRMGIDATQPPDVADESMPF